jgi:hypothetical protein
LRYCIWVELVCLSEQNVHFFLNGLKREHTAQKQ